MLEYFNEADFGQYDLEISDSIEPNHDGEWSFGCLWDLLPKEIEKDGETYDLQVRWGYLIRYTNQDGDTLYDSMDGEPEPEDLGWSLMGILKVLAENEPSFDYFKLCD